MLRPALDRLSAEIDVLVTAMTGAPPQPALEREIALLVWAMRHRRMTPRERAIYHNLLARQPRAYTLQSRIDDLIEELKLW